MIKFNSGRDFQEVHIDENFMYAQYANLSTLNTRRNSLEEDAFLPRVRGIMISHVRTARRFARCAQFPSSGF